MDGTEKTPPETVRMMEPISAITFNYANDGPALLRFLEEIVPWNWKAIEDKNKNTVTFIPIPNRFFYYDQDAFRDWWGGNE